jgi:16S rRNA (adenine1518-N6/adenine1519-N6)-dimethyltransferase
MVQNEVADDYTAKVPNSKFLSNYSQIFSTVEYVYKVKKDQFKPKPKVDGGVIKFSFKSKVGVKDSAEFIKFLKQGFSAPRKTLTNALKNYDRKIIINILKNNNLTQKARSAELSFETWVELFENLR